MKILGKYKNGNTFTTIFTNGTKMRFTFDDDFKSDFAENIDIKITNRCTGTNCLFCHEGSGPSEMHGDILNLKFIDTLHPFQEIAIGGGNALEHPDLIPFLEKLKEKQVIANITVHQFHFLKNFDYIRNLIKKKLIYGVGVSLIYPTDELIKKIQLLPNCVVHVINGIVTPEVLNKIINKKIKILFLGYKKLRRGQSFYDEMEQNVLKNQKYVQDNIQKFINDKVFQAISFDNLAIEQLNIKNILSNNEFNHFYMGNEGSNTFYIDCVKQQFSRSSTEPFENRYPLLDSVDEMFHFINKSIKTE